MGLRVVANCFFDTVRIHRAGGADALVAAALDRGINIRRVDVDTVSVTVDETTTSDDVRRLLEAWGGDLGPHD